VDVQVAVERTPQRVVVRAGLALLAPREAEAAERGEQEQCSG
jgi:hypothetical protein